MARGDTLGGILRAHGLNPRDASIVAALNGLSDANAVRAGAVLRIPTREEIETKRQDLGTAAGSAPKPTAAGPQRAVTDGLVPPRGGISSRSAGAAAIATPKETSSPPLNVFQLIHTNSRVVDTDQDGLLTEADLRRLELNPAIKGDLAVAVAVLITLRPKLEALCSTGVRGPIALADLERLAVPRDGMAFDLAEQAARLAAHLKHRLADSSRTVFANGLPNYAAVKQGQLGDCYFVAAVASLARRDPQAVSRMITDRGDGTYTVAIGDQNETVTVTAPTDVELALHGSAGADGMWLAILEKAYATHRNLDLWEINRHDRPKDVIEKGGLVWTGLAGLRGRGTDADVLKVTSDDVTREKLTEAIAGGRAITAGLGDGARGLPGRHAYAVLDYDRAHDTVTLMNPWGHAEAADASGRPVDGNDDGIFTLPLTEFSRLFDSIAYEEGDS